MHAKMKLEEEEKEPKLDLSPKMKKRDEKLEQKARTQKDSELVKPVINVKPQIMEPKKPGMFAKMLKERSNDHMRAAMNSRLSSLKAGETVTLTFGDCAENHVGMEQIGERSEVGFNL